VAGNPDQIVAAERARRQQMLNAAERAVDDPAALARAARIVRAALARNKLSLGDLLSEGNKRVAS
jgi:hypothetical protein